MSSGHPVKTPALRAPLMAAATTLPSAAEVMDVTNTMIVREEEELIVDVAEVSDAGAVTTTEVAAEVVVEVNTTSTGRWMTIAMDMMAHMMARVDKMVVEVEEGVTPWTIDIQPVFGHPKAGVSKCLSTGWSAVLSVTLRFFIMSKFGSTCIENL